MGGGIGLPASVAGPVTAAFGASVDDAEGPCMGSVDDAEGLGMAMLSLSTKLARVCNEASWFLVIICSVASLPSRMVWTSSRWLFEFICCICARWSP